MHAVILAGGKGTRLSGVISGIPKPLAPVEGRPFIERLLLWLRSRGVRTVTLCTGHLGERLEAHFGAGQDVGLQIGYSHEVDPLGTGGALRLSLDSFEAEDFFVLNGDSFCAVDFAAMHRAQTRSPLRVTLAVVPNPDPARFGSVIVDQQDRIVAFAEKQTLAGACYANAGVYLISRRAAARIAPGRACSLERDVFPAWVEHGITAYRADGPILDIGTPETFAAAPHSAAFAQLEAASQSTSAVRNP